MNVLLTGASGRLGRSMFQALADAGHDVRGSDRRALDDPPGVFIEADLLDAGAVRELVAGCQAVVHLGNHPTPFGPLPDEELYQQNITMNRNVFDAAVEAGVRCIVFSSSIQVICGGRLAADLQNPSCLAAIPLHAHSPARLGSGYARSKFDSENLLRELARTFPDRSFTAVRFPWLLGPKILGEDRRPRPVTPGGWMHVDETYAYLTREDAAGLVLAILDRRLPGYHQYMPSAGNTLGLTPAQVVRRYYPDVPLSVPIEQLNTLVDISDIQRDLGWRPRDVDIFQPAAAPGC